ncbi:hypothetical protein C8A05DRAFT_38438 [Staphylotrichum tortipilum]|uniref:Uncharacterized protein n=1 Tax=Staphylotrichum tortipilum TaxID=2831512 RepID=A0AAN6MDL2_9PEZI|nr:hypothetical protein C8A05DRAFT_38438 [Staphylotrichum longicolle]
MRERVYCVIPAQTTGDLWHLTAAWFLSRAHGRDPNNNVPAAETARAAARAGDFGLFFDLWITVIFHGDVFKIAELEREVARLKAEFDSYEAALKRLPGGGTRAQKKTENEMKAAYTKAHDHLAEIKKQVLYGAVLYNFLRQVGVNVMVVFLESKQTKPNELSALSARQTSMKTYMLKLSDEQYDFFHVQNQNLLLDSETGEVKAFTLADIIREARQRKEWGGIMGTVSTPDAFAQPEDPKNPTPPRAISQYRVFGYMVATTIAMQALEDPALRRRRIADLSKHMSQISEPMIHDALRRPRAPWTSDELARVEQEAQKKWKELDGLIYHLRRRVTGPAGRGKVRFILYNHRVNAKVNTGTNSSKTLFTAFKNIITRDSRRRHLETMIVVINSSSEPLGHRFDGNPVLDLFNKNINAPYPGLEPIVTSRFWNIVASQPDIFGVFSGRSGSVDVAIFHGVNVLWWDEPWLPMAAREPDTMRWYNIFDQDTTHPAESKAFRNWTLTEITNQPSADNSTQTERTARPWLANDRDQVDQCLRCLQMAAISSVCLVNPRNQPGMTLQQVEQNLELVPISLADYRMNIEAGKRTQAPNNQRTHWDPNATWRVHSTLLDALARLRQPTFVQG